MCRGRAAGLKWWRSKTAGMKLRHERVYWTSIGWNLNIICNSYTKTSTQKHVYKPSDVAMIHAEHRRCLGFAVWSCYNHIVHAASVYIHVSKGWAIQKFTLSIVCDIETCRGLNTSKLLSLSAADSGRAWWRPSSSAGCWLPVHGKAWSSQMCFTVWFHKQLAVLIRPHRSPWRLFCTAGLVDGGLRCCECIPWVVNWHSEIND